MIHFANLSGKCIFPNVHISSHSTTKT